MPLWRQVPGQVRVGDRVGDRFVAEIRMMVPLSIKISNYFNNLSGVPLESPRTEVLVPFARLAGHQLELWK